MVSEDSRGLVRVLEKEGSVWKTSAVLENSAGDVVGALLCVAISADGERVVFGDDCEARLWEKKSGVWERVGVLQGHARYVWSLAICTEIRRIVSASEDCDVRL